MWVPRFFEGVALGEVFGIDLVDVSVPHVAEQRDKDQGCPAVFLVFVVDDTFLLNVVEHRREYDSSFEITVPRTLRMFDFLSRFGSLCGLNMCANGIGLDCP